MEKLFEKIGFSQTFHYELVQNRAEVYEILKDRISTPAGFFNVLSSLRNPLLFEGQINQTGFRIKRRFIFFNKALRRIEASATIQETQYSTILTGKITTQSHPTIVSIILLFLFGFVVLFITFVYSLFTEQSPNNPLIFLLPLIPVIIISLIHWFSTTAGINQLRKDIETNLLAPPIIINQSPVDYY